MQTAQKITVNKIFLLSVGIICAMGIILARLAYLQIHLNDLFYHQSEKNFLRLEIIKPVRGNIVDIHGNLLATNRPVHNLYWIGSGNQTIQENQRHMLEQLETILESSLLSNAELIAEIKRAERHQKKILLKADLSFSALCQLEELFPEYDNLAIETEFQRYYPHDECASHILGYLGNIKIEPKGRMGIEQIFEEQLRGKEGIKQKTINSFGRSLAAQTLEEALIGDDIQTTIDLELQRLVEAIFPSDHNGTCILMNPADGSIVALVSRPNFDPNIFLSPLSANDWQTLQSDQLFLNRAFGASYPPGSIFKLITATAALAEGIINQDTYWTCRGYITFVDRKYLCQCPKTFGYGQRTAQQALTCSCNTFFYEIAKKISIDILADYAHRFGLGQKTSSHVPEKTGLIPSSRWKLQTKGERWWPGETLSATIGQSYLLVTPIQIARMIAGIFTGYLVSPRIVTTEEIITTPIGIDRSIREFLQESMRTVITQGTGQKISRLKDFEIFAKTSTAQTSSLEKRDLGKSYLEHGWFVAHFRYKNHEPLVLVFLIENIGTSRITTSFAKQLLIEYKKLMESRVSSTLI